MKLSIRHNLTDDELAKALASLATAQGIEGHITDALQKAACDCGPKEPRDPAMKELYARFRKEYQAAVKDILAAIERIVTGEMEKAQKPAAPLTKQQIASIQQAIKDRFSWVAAQMQDDFTPPVDLLDRWKIHGWVDKKTKVRDFALAVTPEKKLLHNAFVFGRLYRAMEKGKSYAEILKLALGMPLKEPDRHAIAVAEQQAANHITALGDDLAKDAAGIIARHNRQKIKQMVIDTHAQKLRAKVLDADRKKELGIATPEKTVTGWKELKSELYHAMDDKSRDWDRVAFYELNDSRQQGQALAIAEELGPKRLVYKMPMPTACPQCKHAYLDEDGNPRVFALDTMIAHGDNIGRKPHPVRAGRVVPGGRKDKAETVKPVAGLMHPWCACLGPYPYTGHEPWAKQKRQGTTVVEPMAKAEMTQTTQEIVDQFHQNLKEALGQTDRPENDDELDIDELDIIKLAEKVRPRPGLHLLRKSNPYHDKSGRFSTANEDARQGKRIARLFEKHKQDGEHSGIHLAYVSKDEGEKIRDKVGVRANGYQHMITTPGLRHMLKHHGDKKTEEAARQVPITEQDFERIPEVIRASNITRGKDSKRGNRTVVYEKGFKDGKIRYVAEMFEAGRALVGLTMYKIEPNGKKEKAP